MAGPFTLLEKKDEVEYVENAESEFVDGIVGHGCELQQDESWGV